MSARSYRVAWPYANVRVKDPSTGSMTVVGLAKDTHLPPTADPDDVVRLLAKGAITTVEQPGPEPKPQLDPEPKADPKAEPKKAPVKAKSDS